ncbi:MAG: riboflavin synthase [Desulfovibrio sp.]|jgi:riboflavin synthase|nr:riboflavin synthase [Desulfovibrio sp.]
MFTGLVYGMGEVIRLDPASGGLRLTFRTLFPPPDWAAGESVCVSGACLSLETFAADSFTAYASDETLAVTTLGGLGRGGLVNLERALALGDRLGGHLVSGHVDALARLEALTLAGASLRARARFPREFAAQIVPKGSVALDGVSLTVNRCGRDFLEVNIIPETLRSTTLGAWKPGQAVNMETDLIGKYVGRLLALRQEGQQEGGLTLDFLRENGYDSGSALP